MFKNTKFKVGDWVKIRPNFESLPDPLGLGMSRAMRKSSVLGTIFKIESISSFFLDSTEYYYRGDDGWSYNENWLMFVDEMETDNNIRNHKNFKVILKIRQMESKRKEKGYAF